MQTLALLALYVGFALGISFLCSLLEATLLSARISTLTEVRGKGRKAAALLLQLKQHRIDDAISAILILNTMANTLGATMAGAQAAHVFGSAWIGIFSGVLTFLILRRERARRRSPANTRRTLPVRRASYAKR